jgi:hypothetical protein
VDGGVFLARKLKETEANYNTLEDNLFPRILDVLNERYQYRN